MFPSLAIQRIFQIFYCHIRHSTRKKKRSVTEPKLWRDCSISKSYVLIRKHKKGKQEMKDTIQTTNIPKSARASKDISLMILSFPSRQYFETSTHRTLEKQYGTESGVNFPKRLSHMSVKNMKEFYCYLRMHN